MIANSRRTAERRKVGRDPVVEIWTDWAISGVANVRARSARTEHKRLDELHCVPHEN